MKVYLVGGSVRDKLLNRHIHDRDFVVVGSTPQQMLGLGYRQVGNDFPVFLHPDTGEEYALARKEISTGDGYKDFKFVFTPDITLKEDCERRDFTINSLIMDESGEIIDYFNGVKDLKNKIIRHINTQHFMEDPLRVLRAARFAAQLDFTIADSTKRLCRYMVEKGMLNALSSERVWKEIEKALYTTNFYKFIEVLDDLDALQILLPEVYNLKEIPENIIYHPEGNSYKHVILTLQQVSNQYNIKGDFLNLYPDIQKEVGLINFGLLCHDLGKALTPKEELPAHHGHSERGTDIIKNLCERLKVPNEFRDFGILACTYHMYFYEFLNTSVKKQYDKIKIWTDNFKDSKNVRLLLKLHRCDLDGRKGDIAQERIRTFENVSNRIETIMTIMWNKTLKDLPHKKQEELSKFKGQQFGKLYRDAMISYLKHHLKENN